MYTHEMIRNEMEMLFNA